METKTFAQPSLLKQISAISKYEKNWVLFHPFIAKKAYKLTQLARSATDSILRDTILDKRKSGGKVDAFRHAFWMALLAQKIKPCKAHKLGIAHEKGNKLTYKKNVMEEGILPDSVSSEMDLYNNKIGIETGTKNKKMEYQSLKKLILSLIQDGKMKIIKEDKQGNYLDCNGNKIDMKYWKGKWNVPKCMVASDQ